MKVGIFGQICGRGASRPADLSLGHARPARPPRAGSPALGDVAHSALAPQADHSAALGPTAGFDARLAPRAAAARRPVVPVVSEALQLAAEQTADYLALTEAAPTLQAAILAALAHPHEGLPEVARARWRYAVTHFSPDGAALANVAALAALHHGISGTPFATDFACQVFLGRFAELAAPGGPLAESGLGQLVDHFLRVSRLVVRPAARGTVGPSARDSFLLQARAQASLNFAQSLWPEPLAAPVAAMDLASRVGSADARLAAVAGQLRTVAARVRGAVAEPNGNGLDARDPARGAACNLLLGIEALSAAVSAIDDLQSSPKRWLPVWRVLLEAELKWLDARRAQLEAQGGTLSASSVAALAQLHAHLTERMGRRHQPPSLSGRPCSTIHEQDERSEESTGWPRALQMDLLPEPDAGEPPSAANQPATWLPGPQPADEPGPRAEPWAAASLDFVPTRPLTLRRKQADMDAPLSPAQRSRPSSRPNLASPAELPDFADRAPSHRRLGRPSDLPDASAAQANRGKLQPIGGMPDNAYQPPTGAGRSLGRPSDMPDEAQHTGRVALSSPLSMPAGGNGSGVRGLQRPSSLTDWQPADYANAPLLNVPVRQDSLRNNGQRRTVLPVGQLPDHGLDRPGQRPPLMSPAQMPDASATGSPNASLRGAAAGRSYGPPPLAPPLSMPAGVDAASPRASQSSEHVAHAWNALLEDSSGPPTPAIPTASAPSAGAALGSGRRTVRYSGAIFATNAPSAGLPPTARSYKQFLAGIPADSLAPVERVLASVGGLNPLDVADQAIAAANYDRARLMSLRAEQLLNADPQTSSLTLQLLQTFWRQRFQRESALAWLQSSKAAFREVDANQLRANKAFLDHLDAKLDKWTAAPLLGSGELAPFAAWHPDWHALYNLSAVHAAILSGAADDATETSATTFVAVHAMLLGPQQPFRVTQNGSTRSVPVAQPAPSLIDAMRSWLLQPSNSRQISTIRLPTKLHFDRLVCQQSNMLGTWMTDCSSLFNALANPVTGSAQRTGAGAAAAPLAAQDIALLASLGQTDELQAAVTQLQSALIRRRTAQTGN